MCDPVSMTVMAVASTGMQVYGAISAGNAADAAAKYNAAALERQARQELNAANMQAMDIRNEGKRHGGEIVAIQGKSGAAIGSGSALDVVGADAQAYEEDALRALYGGQIKAWGLKTEAGIKRYEGKVAKQQGYIKAAGTLLGSAAKMSFASASPTPGTPSPAPNSSLLSNPYQSTRFG
jgi:hypothetical protein